MDNIITPDSTDRFPLLFAESQPCDLPISDNDRVAIDTMRDTLIGLGGQAAGLAAVQIGYPRRIFALSRDNKIQFFINPVIVDQSTETTTKKEGCLSLPNMEFRIARPQTLTLRWFDDVGGTHEQVFTNFWARAVCHEIDHLNGTILAEHKNSVLVKDVPRSFFKNQTGFIIRDDAFRKRVAKRRAKKKRAKTR